MFDLRSVYQGCVFGSYGVELLEWCCEGGGEGINHLLEALQEWRGAEEGGIQIHPVPHRQWSEDEGHAARHDWLLCSLLATIGWGVDTDDMIWYEKRREGKGWDVHEEENEQETCMVSGPAYGNKTICCPPVISFSSTTALTTTTTTTTTTSMSHTSHIFLRNPSRDHDCWHKLSISSYLARYFSSEACERVMIDQRVCYDRSKNVLW